MSDEGDRSREMGLSIDQTLTATQRRILELAGEQPSPEPPLEQRVAALEQSVEAIREDLPESPAEP